MAGERKPGSKIIILEKSRKLLSKVKVSGGGRCNVTHDCPDPRQLSQHYPREEKPLRSVFKTHNAVDTATWFEDKGVKLKTEHDGRMFPVTDKSQTIIDCFLSEAERLGIEIETGIEVTKIHREGNAFFIGSLSGKSYKSRRILIATGGSPKTEGYSLVRDLGHTIRDPIPSLFTFNDEAKEFSDLMGVAVPDAEVRIIGTKLKQRGPLLITHWGLSGPAVIKLSAWAAEYLHSVKYDFRVAVSWIGPVKEEDIRQFLFKQKEARLKQKIYGHPLFEFPQRIWVRLCRLAEIPEDKIWGDIALRNLNKLLEYLIRCPFHIQGKTTFKEEFVTCGGVDLREVDLSTMESKIVKGLYFAGEVLNIDGETGGFNFQAAWSTAYIAATSAVAERVKK